MGQWLRRLPVTLMFMVLSTSAVVFTVRIICSPCTSTGARGFVTMFTTSDFRLGSFSFLFVTLGLACFRVRFLSYKAQFNRKFYEIIQVQYVNPWHITASFCLQGPEQPQFTSQIRKCCSLFRHLSQNLNGFSFTTSTRYHLHNATIFRHVKFVRS